MIRLAKIGIVATLMALASAAFVVLFLLPQHGFSAREQPRAIEAFVARRLRRLAVPRSARRARNPVPATAEILAEARAHFADHCAVCHANDGSGSTEIGRNLYPKAPDMRKANTQPLSDGELFYIIHNGIRLTGMPAWGSSDAEKDLDSWKLVHFIRRLPTISAEELVEMKKMNPKSRHEMEEEQEIRRFLAGDDGETPRKKSTTEEEENIVKRRMRTMRKGHTGNTAESLTADTRGRFGERPTPASTSPS